MLRYLKPHEEKQTAVLSKERDLSCLIGRQLAAAASILASDFSESSLLSARGADGPKLLRGLRLKSAER